MQEGAVEIKDTQWEDWLPHLPRPPPPKKRGKSKKKMEKKNERNIESGHLYLKAELLVVDILSLNATCVLSFITGGKLLLHVAQKVSRFWD